MSFNQPLFYLFFGAVFVANSAFAALGFSRIIALLIGSLIFYGAIDRSALPIALILSLVTFFSAQKISTSVDKQRRFWFYLSSALLLTVLVLVKLRAHQTAAKDFWHGAIPLGISFYSFQALGYLIDVYRGANPLPKYFQLLTSWLYFPSISAGPILNARNMVQQFQHSLKQTAANNRWAVLLIANGLVKKNIADLLEPTTTGFFATGASHDVLTAWTAVLALSAQIYADFSGYTDIAIGLSLLLGIQLPENFRLPFLATSVSEHWRRWHISLSDWFRQYVFSPFAIALARKFPNPKNGWLISGVAIVICMTLIGIWHGISFNYFIWGLLNGLFICATPWIRRFSKGFLAQGVPAILLTFYLTAVIRVLTASPSFAGTLGVWRDLHASAIPVELNRYNIVTLSLVIFSLVFPHTLDWILISRRQFFEKSWLTWILITLMLAITFSTSGRFLPFVYVQF